jgi:hypothetical protein
VKERTERAEAAKSTVQTNLGDWNCRFLQEELRSFKAALAQVMMRCLMECGLERPQQMKGRQASGCSYFRQADRRIQMGMKKIAGPVDPPPKFLARRSADRRQFLGRTFDEALSSQHRRQQFPQFLLQPIILDDLSILKGLSEHAELGRNRLVMAGITFEE